MRKLPFILLFCLVDASFLGLAVAQRITFSFNEANEPVCLPGISRQVRA